MLITDQKIMMMMISMSHFLITIMVIQVLITKITIGIAIGIAIGKVLITKIVMKKMIEET